MAVLITSDGVALYPGLYEVLENVQNPAPNTASTNFFHHPVIPRGTQLIASQLVGHPWEPPETAGALVLTHSLWSLATISQLESPTFNGVTLWDRLVPYLHRLGDIPFVPIGTR